MSADRDLLFGLLALQNGLIDQEQLVAAFQAWIRDKTKSLADHLIDRRDLDEDQCFAVEVMVNLHLKKHGGDAEKSLASVPKSPAMAKLSALGDDDLERAIQSGDPTPCCNVSDPTPPRPDDEETLKYSVGSTTSEGQRFRVLRPHAQGGLGAVFVALDGELNREVALKQILEHHADNLQSRQRFVVEAEITGGLEHPGIVPVYGLGAYKDGRPYYAMRFIRGDSLKQAIEQFHNDATLKADPGRRSLALRKLLRRFIDVCNAIEYAHSRGVLHRDIKPGNVIVGKHGETLVVDWGLAKALGERDEAEATDERTLRPASSSGSAETLPGSALGTPAYMSPEQARGDLKSLGPHSDVYSLGATFYSLLTGTPAFKGDMGTVLRQVKAGQFPTPREQDPAIDKALEAICLRAMATQPEDRYARCRELAEDVERWMADEPVTAYREPATVRARRWIRHHRTLVTTAASALVILATVLIAIGIWQNQLQRDRIVRYGKLQTQLESAVAYASEEPLNLERWETALLLADQAVEAIGPHTELAPSQAILALQQRLNMDAAAAQADDAFLAELVSTRTAWFDLGSSGVERGYARAFSAYGLDLDSVATEAAAQQLLSRPAEFVAEVVAMLDDWISIRRRITSEINRLGPLVDLAIALDGGPARAQFRRLLREPDLSDRLEDLCSFASADRLAVLPAPMAVLLARSLVIAGDRDKAIGVLRDAATRHPDDVWANYDLAQLYDASQPPRRGEAKRFYAIARVLRPETAHALAFLLWETGERFEATIVFADLVALRPNDARHLAGYGTHLKNLGQFDESSSLLEIAVTNADKELKVNPQNVQAHNSRGFALNELGRFDEAIEAYDRALDIDPQLAKVQNNRGNTLRNLGRSGEAIEAYDRALNIDPQYAMAHNNRGNALNDLGRFDEAIETYDRALDIDPQLAMAHSNRGNALSDLEHFLKQSMHTITH